MATSKTFMEYVQDQCAGLDVRYRAMMGEYILYYRNRVAGGLYDNRFLVKDVPAVRALMPDAVPEVPYPGAKPLIPVDRLDDGEFLARLLEEMYPQLPAPKKKGERT